MLTIVKLLFMIVVAALWVAIFGFVSLFIVQAFGEREPLVAFAWLALIAVLTPFYLRAAWQADFWSGFVARPPAKILSALLLLSATALVSFLWYVFNYGDR